MGGLVAACGGSTSAGAPSTTAVSTHVVHPTRTYAGPAGLTAGGQPQPNGYLWLLAKSHGSANLQQLNLTTGKVVQVVPESAGADSISQSPSGVLGVGVGTSTTGAVEFRNGSSGVLLSTVPIGAPVKGVFAGADGTTFYALNGTASSSSVTLVDSQTDKATVSVPVPLDTKAIAVDPSGADLFALGAGGTLDDITIGSQTVNASFTVGTKPIQLAVSPNGSTIYVLNSDGSIDDVGVIDANTERQTKALPAPTNAVGLQVSIDGQSLYDIVGTPSYGNVQVFPIGS
jgi:DNA-binding beta-propeller fold protein YncE